MMIAGMIFAALAAYKTRLIIFVILIPLGLADFLNERRHERWGLAAELRNYAAEQRSYARRIAAGLDVIAGPPPEPRAQANLSRRAIPAVFAAYVGLAAALLVVMLVMRHEPGAAAALNVLQG